MSEMPIDEIQRRASLYQARSLERRAQKKHNKFMKRMNMFIGSLLFVEAVIFVLWIAL